MIKVSFCKATGSPCIVNCFDLALKQFQSPQLQKPEGTVYGGQESVGRALIRGAELKNPPKDIRRVECFKAMFLEAYDSANNQASSGGCSKPGNNRVGDTGNAKSNTSLAGDSSIVDKWIDALEVQMVENIQGSGTEIECYMLT